MDRLGTVLEIKRVEQRIISGHAAAWSLDRVGDIIEPTAFQKCLSEKQPCDVAVFVGHQTQDLPIGVPIKIEPDAHGLYTEVKVFDGPRGDDLLAAAKGLRAAGRTLGLSIGYRVRDSKYERVGSKSVRKLLDVDLIEFSYAAAQTIANPDALMTSVKQLDGDEEKAAVGSFAWTMQRVQAALAEKHERGCYIQEMFANRVVYRVWTGDEVEQLYESSYSVSGDTVTLGDPTPVDVQYVPMPNADNKTAQDHAEAEAHDSKGAAKVELPNSAFLYVEPGDDDESGLRVPRTKRHFPYRDAEGKINAVALAIAVKSIHSSDVTGLDVTDRRRLAARARYMLEHPEKAPEVDGDEWKMAAPAMDMLAVAYELIDTADRVVDEHKALQRLGDDTKQGKLVRAELRQSLSEAADNIARIVDTAEIVAKGLEEKAAANWWRAQFDFSEVTV